MKKSMFVMILAAILVVGMSPSFGDHPTISKDDGSFIIAKGGGGGFSGGGRGGGFSSGGGRSFSSGSKSSGGGWGKSSSSSSSKASPAPSSKSSSSGWGSSSKPSAKQTASAAKTLASTPPETQAKVAGGALNGNRNAAKMTPAEKKADNAAYTLAKSKGTAFATKGEAVSNFKKNANTLCPNKFTEEPKSRPSYIPNTYSVGGRDVQIYYDRGRGGYGYMDPLTNAFIMYSVADMATDAMMMSAMTSHGYYVGTPAPIHGVGYVISMIFAVVMGILIIGFIIVWLKNDS